MGTIHTPAPRLMRHAAVLGTLARHCREAGGVSAWARAHGIAPEYVSGFLTGSRPGQVGGAVLRALGLRRVVAYERAPRGGEGGHGGS